jgi:hypothetical protein
VFDNEGHFAIQLFEVDLTAKEEEIRKVSEELGAAKEHRLDRCLTNVGIARGRGIVSRYG